MRNLKVFYDKLSEHPYYPSLSSYTDTLSEFGIESAALRLDSLQFLELIQQQVPFFATITIENREEIVLCKSVKNNRLTYYYNKKYVTRTVEEFQYDFSGTVLPFFPEKKGFLSYLSTKEKLNLIIPKVLIGLSLLLLFIICIYQGIRFNTPREFLFLLTFYLAGTIFSGLLVAKELMSEGKLLDAICKKFKSNCDKVIESDSAKLFNWISWAELGGIYFIGSFFFTVVNFDNLLSASVFLWLLALPTVLFSFYSAYYQLFIAKEFCVFCSSLLVIFWSIFSVLTYYLLPIYQSGYLAIDILLLTKFLFVMILPFTLWLIIRIPVTEYFKMKIEIRKLKKIKFTESVFELMHNNNHKITNNNDLIRVTEGNAANQITIVTDPKCKPCKKVHKIMDKLLQGNFGDIDLQVVFSGFEKHGSMSYKVVESLINLYHTEKNKFKEAFANWYECASVKEQEKWLKHYTMTEIRPETGDVMKAHTEWCIDHKVSYTPTIFYNGVLLDKDYSLDDLKYLLN